MVILCWEIHNLHNLGTIDDIKLRIAVDPLDGRKGLQRDPDKLDS